MNDLKSTVGEGKNMSISSDIHDRSKGIAYGRNDNHNFKFEDDSGMSG